MSPPPTPKYTREEMSEILHRALERQEAAGEVSHTELVDAAREVGIDASAVDAAAREIQLERTADAGLEGVRRDLRARFYRSLVTYLAVNAFLLAMNAIQGGGRWWSLFVLLGWGLGLLFQAMNAFFPRPEYLRRRLERQQRTEQTRALLEAQQRVELQRKAERHARREARRVAQLRKAEARDAIRHGAREFERAVEEGVAALLGSIARRIDQELKPTDDPRVRVEARDAREASAPRERDEVERSRGVDMPAGRERNRR